MVRKLLRVLGAPISHRPVLCFHARLIRTVPASRLTSPQRGGLAESAARHGQEFDERSPPFGDGVEQHGELGLAEKHRPLMIVVAAALR
jgi:hypothetical protein